MPVDLALAPALPSEPQLRHYQRWLQQHHGLHFDTYDALWHWSVSDLNGFWQSIWDYFELQSPTPHSAVLAEALMPGARWFPGAQLNYAQQVLRHVDSAHVAGHPAMVWTDEAGLTEGRLHELSWPALQLQVGALAASLQRLGVQRGDRVVAVLPNRPEAALAFLATASLGAIWSICSPDMGPVAVLDRFAQIEPTVLIAGDGYRFGGVAHDRRAVIQTLVAGLPTLRQVVDVPVLGQALSLPSRPEGTTPQLQRWADLIAGPDTLAPAWLPFEHPLWVVYSSGTTGLPKPIVHGHGGILLEGLKGAVLHNNLGPSAQTGERFFWYSSTGWIMWNCQVSGLLGGTTICLFDGSPAGTAHPADWTALWRFAALSRCSFFGAGAAFYASCLKAGVQPQQQGDLAALRAIGSTGSPLADDAYHWIWDRLPRVNGQPIWIACISGGTDFAGAFLAGAPELPLVAGEMQCRCLGAAVEAWSEPDASGRGASLVDEVGELVCTAPMPSMPLYLWGDEPPGPCGQRLHESYFDMYPGVWRHGDWLRLVPHEQATGAIIYGRSDATINRQGIRMGTAELYRAVEALPAVLDSLVVDLEYLGRDSYMPLFVVLREGRTLDDALVRELRQVIREALSPRHVPNEIFQVPAIPRTLSGKKMELPVKKLLQGAAVDAVFKRDAMANAACLSWFETFAQNRGSA